MNISVKQSTTEQSFSTNRQSRQRQKTALYFIKPAIKLIPRILTNQIRVMPDFLIIGAAKCGTSSLYSYLTPHSCVAPALRKEIYFFDRTFRRSLAWYRAFFPTALEKYYSKQMHKKVLITGESTPSYIFHPHAPKRIFETIPGVKLIVLLRNPVDRAYSFYHQQFKRGIDTLSFEEAIEREEERLRGELGKMLNDDGYFSFNRQNYSYLSRGIYVEQLENWIGLFPREQFLILTSEHLFADPSRNFGRVIEFLNLPSWEPKEYKKFHSATYPKMDAKTRERLTEYFEPYNRRLYEFLGMNLGWDK